MTPAQQELSLLAEQTMEKLKTLTPPIVRVDGPLTTGLLAYEENVRRFHRAEEVLIERGFSVFTFDLGEAGIKDRGYSSEDILEFFHKPILQSGLIKQAYFLPHWEESQGATWERNYMKEHTPIEIKEFSEDLLLP